MSIMYNPNGTPYLGAGAFTNWNAVAQYGKPYTTVYDPFRQGETDYTPRPPATAKDAYMRGQPYYSNPKQEYLNRGTTQPVSVPPIYGVPSYSQPFNRPMKTQYSQSPYGLQVARNRQMMNVMRRREQIARQRQMEAQRMYGTGGMSGAYGTEAQQAQILEDRYRSKYSNAGYLAMGYPAPEPTPVDRYRAGGYPNTPSTSYQPTPVDRYRAGGYPAPGNREGGYGTIRPAMNSIRRAMRNYQRDNPVDSYERPDLSQYGDYYDRGGIASRARTGGDWT